MQTYNNEIRVHRNETFTLDYTYKMPDGSPYIVSNMLGNPYFLLTISSSKYDQEGRYLKSFWVDLNSETDYIDEYGEEATLIVPKFKLTQPIDLRRLTTGASSTTPVYNDWSDVQNDFSDNGYIEGYYNGAHFKFDSSEDAVYTFGEDYKYWNGEDGTDCELIAYNGLRVVVEFSRDITREWVEGNYLYSIRLVAGDAMSTYLMDKCEQYGVPITSTDPVELYTALLQVQDETLQHILADLDPTMPLANIKAVVPILNPSKLIVLADQQGGLDDYR